MLINYMRGSVKQAVCSLLVLLISSFFIASRLEAANTFTVTLPANTEITMGDPAASLPVTIANSSSSGKDIKAVTFTVNTTKYSFLNSNGKATTNPPAGWCVSSVSAGSISFGLKSAGGLCPTTTNNGYQIPPGGSLIFNLYVLPLAASADVANDTFSGVSVSGFTRSGPLPAWTKRAFAATMTAVPLSTATGGIITLEMNVVNRSNAAQTFSSSATSPSPPSPSNAIVTNTAGPYYGSTVLVSAVTVAASAINVSSTTGFPSAGTIGIDSEQICYVSKTATSFTGLTRGCNGTTAAAHSVNTTVYSLTPFSLAPGASGTLTWLYSADVAGSVYFTARATNNSATSKSISVNSNTVIIGNFTAAVTVSPSTVVSGQNVTVQMTVYNNGTQAVINAVPSALTPCGSAAMTLVSGPVPSSIASIPAGSSGVFQWTYAVTGSVGQTYCISGNATANGGLTTNTSTSNTGSLSAYSALVSPSAVSSGAANVTLTWTVVNGGGYTIAEVDIATPVSGGNWNCGSVSPPSGWSGSCASTVAFTGGSIAPGSANTFSITFSTTQTVTSDTLASFPVTVLSSGPNQSSYTINSAVTVTAYLITLTNSPAGPVNADGSSQYTMTAVLSTGGQYVPGQTITFTTTSGSLNPASAVTDVNGQAAVALISPYSTTNTTAAVIASYLSASATDTVSFTGWTGPELVYWGGLTPMSVTCGNNASFQVNVKNIGASSMNLTANSYFAFNDYSAGGCTVYKAYLDTGSTGTIAAGGTKTLTFSSPANNGGGGGVLVPATFIAGLYEPVANLTPPPASGMFLTDGTNNLYRTVTDKVTVTGSCNQVKINVIDWRELR